MRVLVTGNLGYLGRRLVGILVREWESPNIEVLGADIGLYCEPRPKISQDVRIMTLPEGLDCVVHLAAIVGEPACSKFPKLAEDINVHGTVNIARQCHDRKIPLIFASTCSVYGARDRVLFEDSETGPLGLYAEQRLEAERFVIEAGGVALRFGTLFGWSERMRLDLVINQWAARVAQDLPIEVNGGAQWRPFTHVDDAARAILTVTRNHQAGEVYNVAGVNYAISALAEEFKRELGCAVIIREDATDKRDYRVNSQKLEALGWEPSRSLDLADLVRRIRANVTDYESPIYSNIAMLNRLSRGS